MPKVSVVLPSYNHAEFIAEATSSVLDQSLSDLELIVVDDGSKDDSLERVRRFSDPRLRVHAQSNQGAHNALNRGIALASAASDYIAILNSDDAYEKDWLESAVRRLEADEALGFCSGRVTLVGDPRPDTQRWYEGGIEFYRRSGDLEQALLRSNFIFTTSNVLFRKRLLKQTAAFRPLRYVHDLDFFLRLGAISGFALLDRPCVRYRFHSGNTIGETAQRRQPMLYEMGWILADRIAALLESGCDPARLVQRTTALVSVLHTPETASMGLILLAQRQAAWKASTDPRDSERFALGLLDPTNPIFIALHKMALAPHLDGMNGCIADLQREIARLRGTRSYRLGDALHAALRPSGLLRLPGRLWDITLGGPSR